MTNLTMRPLVDADLPAVLAAEAVLHESPWSSGNFRDSIAADHQLWVAEDGDALLGYAVSSQVLDEAELLTIGILPAYQRRGYGRELLRQVLTKAHAAGAQKMFLEVRSGNHPAHALYLREGFAEIGRRRGYYPAKAGREDAIVMAFDMERLA